MNRTFDSVLVANRGEIAVRILRSARAAGYRTIAIYSDADAHAPHVALADEAVRIGPAPVQESYLCAERILEAAALAGAGAVHPGYGFLSENAAFARGCREAGLVFVGPSPEAIELMGNKAAAKRRMLEAGVPCIPGYQDPAQSDDALLDAAHSIGLPVMVKAAAGGGGRGMRLVEREEELPAALASARSEAKNAFGSDELILEKAVVGARHVEIQVFGDVQGNVIHLGERDCSVQRRHQKVIEEAPCPVMTGTLREAMGGAAVAAAQSIAYVGAGTVEFLLDVQGNFYFLEMNTRLQVEHPVTERVTGLDLVDLQLHVARGEPLPLAQEAVALAGHAIEVRLYAEDASSDFLPASGTAHDWEPPAGEGIRVDHGLVSGQVVSPFYDPMIAKIIAFGEDRETARRRLLRALRDTVIIGIETNREFLVDALGRASFADGAATTAFIEQEYPGGYCRPAAPPTALAIGALLMFLAGEERSRRRRVRDDRACAGMTGTRPIDTVYALGPDVETVALRSEGGDRYTARVAGETFELVLEGAPRPRRLHLSCAGLRSVVAHAPVGEFTVSFQWRGATYTLEDALGATAAAPEGPGGGEVVAPMHGNLLALRVAVGDRVSAGDELAVMEAMKMEHRLAARIDGTVAAIHVRVGDQLAAGALVLELEAADDA